MTPSARRNLLTAALALVPCLAYGQRPLKVYISADMEGVAGVVTGDQLGPTGFEYDRFRGFMTAEVLAAIQGARDAGATTIVVSDSHGNGENLLIERFTDDVTIVRSWPRPLGMMSSATLTGVRLNGVAMPESGINAAIAGRLGVPIVAISGDDAAVAEAQKLIGNMEGAVVKQAISFHAAATMTPEAAQKLIREKVKAGVARRGEMRPYTVTTPIRLEVSFKHYRQAEILAYLSVVERIDSHSIRFTSRDITEISKFLEFIDNYQSGLLP